MDSLFFCLFIHLFDDSETRPRFVPFFSLARVTVRSTYFLSCCCVSLFLLVVIVVRLAVFVLSGTKISRKRCGNVTTRRLFVVSTLFNTSVMNVSASILARSMMSKLVFVRSG